VSNAKQAPGAPTEKPDKKKKKGAPPVSRLLGRCTLADVQAAYERLARAHALPTLVRGALQPKLLRRLLRDAVPRHQASEMPEEVWSSLAVGIALESPEFALTLAETLHECLGWDREPAALDDWWPVVVERPLEALWNAALSPDKSVRKEFAHVAEHCLENWRDSPECTPPSWPFVDGVLEIHAQTQRALREAERRGDDAERRLESERERLDELREELKRLRRENAELRSDRARAERRAEELAQGAAPATPDERRVEELERRARKAEKERDHAWAEMERLRAAAQSAEARVPGPAGDDPRETDDGNGEGDDEGALARGEAGAADGFPVSSDPNPRRRVIRQMLRKLVKKGKIGAAHTHEDNVYRGVADHEKGIAKDAIDLLYREGFFVPKPTAADPHVSIAPERLAEVQALIAGRVENARLLRFLEE
jgi:hypothetical protein